ncbi:MAG: phenylalanine--tRNA ligase subunit beta [Chlamydiales bacterium]|nr:phenylalanine--tRNA ligase subunit beta [Chlamydiales bacterium]
MKAPLSWLKQFISIYQTPEELSRLFTLAGLEVDFIYQTQLPIAGIVSAKIVKTEPHPTANHLTIAHVFDGTHTVQVVCAAKNCKQDLITAFAKIGSTLKRSDETIVIKQATLKGVESFGMLCSPFELGISDDNSGILQMPIGTPLGLDIKAMFDDVVLEISLTPNLGHCMSMLGLARELKSLLNSGLDFPQIHFEESSHEHTKDIIQIQIDDSHLCHQYSCRYVHGIKNHVTPFWMQQMLEKVNIRPKHLVVDVLNYVMLECGQPMHAFDATKLAHKKIRVGLTSSATSFKTLDQETRDIPAGMLMIFDDKTPIAIAGVMGGENSCIDENTSQIIIESAHFDSSAIRKSMKTLSLRSESSARFEKGIDKLGIEIALDRAVSLIQKYGSATIAQGVHSVITIAYQAKNIKGSLENITRILGIHLSINEIESLLSRLDIEVKYLGDHQYLAIPPSYRNDIQYEIDIIEEIARIYGYNNIPMTHPRYVGSDMGHHPLYLFEKKIRSYLLQQGLQELLTCDLISPEEATIGIESSSNGHEVIHVLHAKSIDQSALRVNFISGLLKSITLNQNHGQTTLAGFEIGKLHFKDESHFKEKMGIGIILSGSSFPDHWSDPSKMVDFYDIKGVVENLFSLLRLHPFHLQHSTLTTFHPGRQGLIACGETLLGVIGEIHPAIQRKQDLKHPVYYAQIDLETLYHIFNENHKMYPLPIFPSSTRDVTFTLNSNFAMENVFHCIRSFSSTLLENVELVNIYKSDKLGSDRLNATFRFTYRDKEKTIELKNVELAHEQIIHHLNIHLKDAIYS